MTANAGRLANAELNADFLTEFSEFLRRRIELFSGMTESATVMAPECRP